ncbi:hypothetical protein [Phyllobacterium sp. OV277]|uniref:hypothetical protein n=1 Tax=Phyllobacterium sp. OV277 TaxID=1882772 RepID=UPI001FCE29C9|nr:hypothetical protein [Phyllobacterium sp. OV277]
MHRIGEVAFSGGLQKNSEEISQLRLQTDLSFLQSGQRCVLLFCRESGKGRALYFCSYQALKAGMPWR